MLCALIGSIGTGHNSEDKERHEEGDESSRRWKGGGVTVAPYRKKVKEPGRLDRIGSLTFFCPVKPYALSMIAWIAGG